MIAALVVAFVFIQAGKRRREYRDGSGDPHQPVSALDRARTLKSSLTEATGSIPVAPTKRNPQLRGVSPGQTSCVVGERGLEAGTIEILDRHDTQSRDACAVAHRSGLRGANHFPGQRITFSEIRDLVAA